MEHAKVGASVRQLGSSSDTWRHQCGKYLQITTTRTSANAVHIVASNRGSAVKSIDLKRWLVLLLVFAVLTSLPWLIRYFGGGVSNPIALCMKKCADSNKEGHLVYRGPATPREAYRVEHAECECR